MNRQTTNYGSIRDPEVGFSGSTNNDVSREFNDLFDNIATNLYTINSSIRTLLDSIKLIGTAKDNAGLRNKLKWEPHLGPTRPRRLSDDENQTGESEVTAAPECRRS
ncbi:hypothetical protein YQE_00397, partial [Dendroctonus ponderosae]